MALKEKEIDWSILDGDGSESLTAEITYAARITNKANVAIAQIETRDKQQPEQPQTIHAYDTNPVLKESYVGEVALKRVLDKYGLLDVYLNPLCDEHEMYETPAGWFVHLTRVDYPGAFHVSYTQDDSVERDPDHFSEVGMVTLEWLPPVPIAEASAA